MLTASVGRGALSFMPQTARIAIPEIRCHITQCGDSGQGVFFTVLFIDDDHCAYVGILTGKSPGKMIKTVKPCYTPQFDTLLVIVLLDFHHISVGIMKPLITQSGAADNQKSDFIAFGR